ncbi:hypothetical protein K2224_11135 [Streptomyces sp. BHT-5-2]|uniref:hypothetical protein n=1 Tax=Streptomyces sp. BHT-5-2 TaxID=2866715 RepID=UPI001C8D5C25|nr:hypothetical protein [Streptomyces sp. BHT-5-2]QZL03673.1 hypothetical protein K2224_11135 [Streptomyces sp. BHT-5-2]
MAPRTARYVLSNKGCTSGAIRTWLRHRDIPHTVPERADQIHNRLRRGSKGGRPPRYDKRVESYHAAIALASVPMWA